MENCNFTNNSGDFGGAVWIYGNGSVENCVFIDNQGRSDEGYGGAIFFSGTGTVENCYFNNNSAEYGATVYSEKEVNVTDSNFVNMDQKTAKKLKII